MLPLEKNYKYFILESVMSFDKKAYREKVAAIGDTKLADKQRADKVKAAKGEAAGDADGGKKEEAKYTAKGLK